MLENVCSYRSILAIQLVGTTMLSDDFCLQNYTTEH